MMAATITTPHMHCCAEVRAAADDAASAVESVFECNVCLELAKEPVVTLCGHLFCWPCLWRWMQVSNSARACPVCKAAVDVDKVIPIYGRGNDFVPSASDTGAGEEEEEEEGVAGADRARGAAGLSACPGSIKDPGGGGGGGGGRAAAAAAAAAASSASSSGRSGGGSDNDAGVDSDGSGGGNDVARARDGDNHNDNDRNNNDDDDDDGSAARRGAGAAAAAAGGGGSARAGPIPPRPSGQRTALEAVAPASAAAAAAGAGGHPRHHPHQHPLVPAALFGLHLGGGGSGGAAGAAAAGHGAYIEALTPEQQHQAFLSRLLLMLGSFVIMCLLLF